MTKTPEELTEDWLNNKLQAGSFWFVETEDSNPEPMVVDMDGDFNDYEGNYYRPCFSKGKMKVLAPVPTYDEYKAMQAAIQNGESAIDTNKRLCKTIEEMKDRIADLLTDLSSSSFYQTVLNEDIATLRRLLEECRPALSHLGKWNVQRQNLLTRINTTLGESEE